MTRVGLVEIGIICFTVLIPIAILILLGLGIWFLAWLSRQSSGTAVGTSPPAERPLDILKARYARGEISKEQFDAMRRDLE